MPSARDVFAERKIGSDQLPPAAPRLLPLDEAGEAQRASRVGEQFGKVAPGVVQYTTDVLFRDLWLRPDLTKPWRVPRVEAALAGASLDPAALRRAAALAVQGARGRGHNDFKIELMQRAIVRAAETAGARA